MTKTKIPNLSPFFNSVITLLPIQFTPSKRVLLITRKAMAVYFSNIESYSLVILISRKNYSIQNYPIHNYDYLSRKLIERSLVAHLEICFLWANYDLPPTENTFINHATFLIKTAAGGLMHSLAVRIGNNVIMSHLLGARVIRSPPTTFSAAQ